MNETKVELTVELLKTNVVEWNRLREEKLPLPDLRHASLRYADLRYADLQYADLRHADLRHADLQYADLRHADLRDADLQYADLQYADLQYADLQYADLYNVVGNNAEIKSLQAGQWIVIWTANVMQIGCERHSIPAWWDFSDGRIDAMNTTALAWWKIWKPILQKIIAVRL